MFWGSLLAGGGCKIENLRPSSSNNSKNIADSHHDLATKLEGSGDFEIDEANFARVVRINVFLGGNGPVIRWDGVLAIVEQHCMAGAAVAFECRLKFSKTNVAVLVWFPWSTWAVWKILILFGSSGHLIYRLAALLETTASTLGAQSLKVTVRSLCFSSIKRVVFKSDVCKDVSLNKFTFPILARDPGIARPRGRKTMT